MHTGFGLIYKILAAGFAIKTTPQQFPMIANISKMLQPELFHKRLFDDHLTPFHRDFGDPE